VSIGVNAFGEFSKSVLPGAPGRCSGGVRVSPGRRSSGYGLLCRPLLPFSRRRGRVQALENSPKAGGTHTRTREEVICSTEFCGTDLGIPHTRTREEHPRFVRILTKRFNSLNNRVRILT
jgi:hypothetical protein